MADVHTPRQRGRNMAAIRGKDTKPELLIRKELHRLGFRYRIHYSALPGKPDLVFPKHKAIVQVNGCFWHKHECHLFKWPSSNREFWRDKIEKNCVRDARNFEEYRQKGWRLLVVWECALKGSCRLPLEAVIEHISSWIETGIGNQQIQGIAEG